MCYKNRWQHEVIKMKQYVFVMFIQGTGVLMFIQSQNFLIFKAKNFKFFGLCMEIRNYFLMYVCLCIIQYMKMTRGTNFMQQFIYYYK